MLILLSNRAHSQNKKIDTTVLKKEIDAVLAKYGLKSKGFAINVISNNQKGGQTAYLITNNYYGDTTTERNNISYSFDTTDKKITLVVSPLKGTWISPFLLTDSSDEHEYFQTRNGFYSSTESIVWIVDRWCNTKTIITPYPVSKFLPFYLQLKDDPNQYFVFGDFTDLNKTFLYYKGKIRYWGVFTNEELKKLPPIPLKW